jgi:5'-nucleotidase (lipoprotein e(P4) family)
MKNKGFLILFSGFIFLLAGISIGAQQEAPVQADNEYQVGATLFHQKAAEYRALTRQAFNLAKMRLDMDKKLRRKLPGSERKKPRAIIVDADETVLDNSPYFAKLIKTRKPFDIGEFFDWKKSGKSKAVPGSVEFLNYAKKKGVDIFYISNVPNSFKEVTVNSLRQNGFPDAEDEHVMLITDSSSKEPRRQKVAETHRVVMFIGDSLNDLSVVFEGKSTAERFAEVDKIKEMWGTKFIVIPNIMYGAWESAVYAGERLSDEEKKTKRIEVLEDY